MWGLWTGSIGNAMLPCFMIVFHITKSLSYKAVDLLCLTIIQPAVVRRLIKEQKLLRVYHEA